MSATATLQRLAFQIADSAARSDIECHCAWTADDPAIRWFDISKIEDASSEKELRPVVDMAVTYLDMRNLITRNPANANWVRPYAQEDGNV